MACLLHLKQDNELNLSVFHLTASPSEENTVNVPSPKLLSVIIFSMTERQDKNKDVLGVFSVPVLDLVGPGHIIDVHSDLVGDVGRQLRR